MPPMKSALKYIIPSLLVFLYITASIGIGVHKCDTDGTSTVVLLLKDASCEDIHQNNHYHNNQCNGTATCSQEHHDHNCCHTEIHHLEQGYDLTHSTLVSQIPYFNLISDLEFCQSAFNLEIKNFDSSESSYGGPPLLHQKNPHSYLAQWRL